MKKTCNRCHITKDISQFYKDRTKKLGVSGICSECSKKYSKNYRQQHQEEILKKAVDWRLHHREEIKKTNTQYYAENYLKLREYRKQYKLKNKEKVRAQELQYRQQHPEKIKEHDLLANHGITLKEYNILLSSQNNVCKICGKLETSKEKNKKVKSLAVDHDHKTGKIRGLLCGKCNKGIGLFQDSIEILTNAICYLQE